MYEGEWKNNYENGQGIAYDEDGNKVYEGRFIDGQIIEFIEEYYLPKFELMKEGEYIKYNEDGVSKNI